MDKLLIIDGNSIANRAFYAMPYLSNRRGKPSGAVFGFANILIKIIQTQTPTHIAVAFDHARKTFRNKIYADYKGQRKPTPPELVQQFPMIKEMLGHMSIQTFEFENIEADDIIGSICNKTACEKMILSGDKDLLQLIDNRTTVCLTRKGVSEIDFMDKDTLKTSMGIAPYQIIELKGLMGDQSDNIPGVKGVGEKTAFDLLEKYQNIENVYKHIDEISGKLKEKLIDGQEMAKISKTLATIKTDCDFDFNLDKCKVRFPFDSEVLKYFSEMDFSSLIKNKNLFSEDVKEPEIVKTERIDLSDKNQLDNLISTVKNMFCFNLKDMTFACDDKREYFLSQNYDMFGSSLSFEDALLAFKTIFENENVLKLTLHLKEDLHTLGKLGIKLNNAFDLELASYVTSAGVKKGERKLPVCEYITEKDILEKLLQEQGTMHIFEDIEMPLVEILKNMEEAGFKINEEKLDELAEYFNNKMQSFVKDIYADAGEEFNINSPKQVAYILFEKLGIKAYNNKKGSTRVDVLDELRFIPIVDNILKFRKLSKIINTYVDVYKKICLNSGDIIHTTFNQTLTSTGRLSSSEPNLQTIPTRDDEGRELRKIFISKFEGGSLISADYNQIELRLLAHMSGEEELIKAYNNGDDIHALTASQIFEVPISKVTSAMRREAKAVNFGIIYGISDYGLSQNIKSTRLKAKEYIDSYFNRYPRVKEFMDSNIEYAKKHGQIATMFGRVRKIPEISSAKYQLRQFGERVAMNMPLQGTASDIIKMAMLRVHDAMKAENMKSQLILQIHDELIIDVFPGEEEKAKKLLKEQMENVAELKVPLVVSIGTGENLYDCK